MTTDRAADRLHVLVAGSTSPLAGDLVHTLEQRGHTVARAEPGTEELPPSHAIHLVTPDADAQALRAEAGRADVVLLLTGLGPLASTVDDAAVLDVVLGHARPGAALVELSPLGIFGDVGGAEADEDAVPEPPGELEAARAAELRTLAASDWLRAVVVRTGLVFADGGGPVLQAAAALAAGDGVSRYVGREGDTYPLVHAGALLEVLVAVVEDAGVAGVVHAVTDWTTAGELARLIGALAGVDRVEAWDEAQMVEQLATLGPVPRVDVRATSSRMTDLVEGRTWPGLAQALAG